MTAEVTRFAPSPTGLLHLGHAFAALFAERAARETGGRFLLRIEDIDAARSRPEFETAIEEEMAWLGLAWEHPVRRQSEHFGEYAAALEVLREHGLLYPCFCTRKEIAAEIAASAAAPQGPDGPLYPGTCRRLPAEERSRRLDAGEAFAWRLDVTSAVAHLGKPLTIDESGEGRERGTIAARPDIFGDVVLARKDVPASYHLAVVVDDAAQGVTLVTRAEDLFPATHLHRLLQHLLGLHAPRYRHHRLITDDTGKRLAKRDQATALRTFRAQGVSANDIRVRLGFTSR
jgi:glutamyl-Q tRNA(Asp) synthetase